MSAEDQINAIIDAALENADEALDVALGLCEDAKYAIGTYGDLPEIEDPDEPNTQDPTYFPNTELADEFRAEFADAFGDFTDRLADVYQTYIDSFFPKYSDGLEEAEDWLIDVIQNGGTGLPEAIENALWERARSRELFEAYRLEDEAVNAFAIRGFSLPTGALAKRLLMVQMEASNKSSTISRDIAIKQAEFELETIKYAVEKASNLRVQIAQATLNYIQAYIQTPALAIDKAKSINDAHAKLWSSATDYYRSLQSDAELTLKWGEIVSDNAKANIKYGVDLDTATIEGKAKTAVGAADAAAKAAAAALSAQNTIANLGDITNRTS